MAAVVSKPGQEVVSRRAIGTLGTISRLALGSAAIAKPLVDGPLEWHEAAMGLILAPAVLVLLQLVRMRWTLAQLNATGPLGLVVTTVVGLTLLNIDVTSDAAFVFIGASTLLAAVRGYAGCELLATSNWLLRRNDQAGCIIFSPVDTIERSVAGGGRAVA